MACTRSSAGRSTQRDPASNRDFFPAQSRDGAVAAVVGQAGLLRGDCGQPGWHRKLAYLTAVPPFEDYGHVDALEAAHQYV